MGGGSAGTHGQIDRVGKVSLSPDLKENEQRACDVVKPTCTAARHMVDDYNHNHFGNYAAHTHTRMLNLEGEKCLASLIRNRTS